MIALEKLFALAAGEDDDETEAHVLSCSACAATLDRLLAIVEGVRDLVSRGRLSVAVSAALLEELEREGIVKRIYRFAPGGVVACQVSVDDVYVAAQLAADLSSTTRVDVVFRMLGRELRLDDVPFDRERGLVIVLERADFLRSLPTHTMLCDLVADGRTLTTYTFNHSAAP
jgi:hypothetical protein